MYDSTKIGEREPASGADARVPECGVARSSKGIQERLTREGRTRTAEVSNLLIDKTFDLRSDAGGGDPDSLS